MASTKVVVATESHKRKDWTIVLTGTGTESRNLTVKLLSIMETKGIKIVSGASPFKETAQRRKPKEKAQPRMEPQMIDVQGQINPPRAEDRRGSLSAPALPVHT